MPEGLRFWKKREEPKKKEETLTHHAAFALEEYERYRDTYPETRRDADPEAVGSVESAKEILEAITEQAIRNSRIFTASDGNAFPVTHINVPELARTLTHAEAGTPPTKQRREFIFGSTGGSTGEQAGNQFVFFEEALHQATLRLPGALSGEDAGTEDEIYMLGLPVNEYGHISDGFLDDTRRENVFKVLAKEYAEFVKSTLSNRGQQEQSVLLQGYSMGANVAAETAHALIAHGVASQKGEPGKPALQVRLDTPTGYSKMTDGRRYWQLPLGFAADMAYNLLANPYAWTAAFKEKAFLASARKNLGEHGIVPDPDPEQKVRKQVVGAKILADLRNGMPLPDDVRVTEVVGTYDPSMYTGAFHEAASEQREAHAGSLGATFVKNEEGNRTAAIAMNHVVPFWRENEMKRIGGAALALDTALKNKA